METSAKSSYELYLMFVNKNQSILVDSKISWLVKLSFWCLKISIDYGNVWKRIILYETMILEVALPTSKIIGTKCHNYVVGH